MIPADWPHAAQSRQIEIRPYHWHLQDSGTGPVMLLLHGAGASTHSFRDLIPLLTPHYRVIALDLPGHGFTRASTRSRLRLDLMAQDIARLLTQENLCPQIIVGHSAGAAIGARICLDHPEIPVFVSINGAFQMFDGLASWLFPLMAKALALNPLTGLIFARTMTQNRLSEILRGTGSQITPEGEALYLRLIKDRKHVEGTLSMMAGWSLDRLNRDLPALGAQTLLLTGAQDQAVPPKVSETLAARLENAVLETIPDLGHLMHEEDPALVAALIHKFVTGALASGA